MLESLEPIVLDQKWLDQMRNLAPGSPASEPASPRRALMISISTGYQHWVIPHTAALLNILADKAGICQIDESDDPESFSLDALETYDAVIFNNTCSDNPERDLFLDILEDGSRAEELRKGVIEYVASGRGLIAIHGGLIAFNNSPDWIEMVGGSFDHHPPQQRITLEPIENDHPLNDAFEGSSFEHIDEPYLFKQAEGTSVHPLLAMTSPLTTRDGEPLPEEKRYAAWIKRYGSGRVFYCSPSHNAQSFEDPRLLRFILDGMQYALGDLDCDDSA